MVTTIIIITASVINAFTNAVKPMLAPLLLVVIASVRAVDFVSGTLYQLAVLAVEILEGKWCRCAELSVLVLGTLEGKFCQLFAVF